LTGSILEEPGALPGPIHHFSSRVPAGKAQIYQELQTDAAKPSLIRQMTCAKEVAQVHCETLKKEVFQPVLTHVSGMTEHGEKNQTDDPSSSATNASRTCA
jgi:hypothetical protein